MICKCGCKGVGFMGRFGWLCKIHLDEIREMIHNW